MSAETKSADEADETVAQAFGRIVAPDISGEAKMASFLGAAMSQNYRDYAAVVQPLIESQQQEIENLRAELASVRSRVTRLVSGRYMPASAAIIGALWAPAGTSGEWEGER
jgi:hypothetical protein